MSELTWHEVRAGRPAPRWARLLSRLIPRSELVQEWRIDRAARYRPSPDCLLTFPPTASGRPGFRVRSFSYLVNPESTGPDGVHSYGGLVLTENRDRMLVFCLGRTADLGTPEDVLDAEQDALEDDGWEQEGAEVQDFGWGQLLVAHGRFPKGSALTTMVVEHRGWLFNIELVAFGPTEEFGPHLRVVLESWTWLDAVTPTAPR